MAKKWHFYHDLDTHITSADFRQVQPDDQPDGRPDDRPDDGPTYLSNDESENRSSPPIREQQQQIMIDLLRPILCDKTMSNNVRQAARVALESIRF